MNKQHSIQYLTQQQIDKDKWDACLDRAANKLVYGYSFYLDAMSKHWDGLVLNDYEAVMPLTWNKKYGIDYLYQPFCCAMLGVFGSGIHTADTTGFMQQVPRKFRYWDIYLNPSNTAGNGAFNFYERKNYTLALGQPYIQLYHNFSNNIKRNIKKSAQLHCSITRPNTCNCLDPGKITNAAIRQGYQQ